MTVAELIVRLSAVDADALVVLAKDSEGNEFGPLDSCECAIYVPSSTWSGELADADDEDEDGHVANGTAALVLWPVN